MFQAQKIQFKSDNNQLWIIAITIKIITIRKIKVRLEFKEFTYWNQKK